MFANSNIQCWGELPQKPEREWDKIVPKDLGKLVIISAIKPELPKPYQPVPDETCAVNSQITVPKECSAIDETVLGTIKLLEHARKVQDLINIATSEDERNVVEKIKNCPPFPEICDKKEKKIKTEEDLKYHVTQGDELSPFAAGQPLDYFPLTPENTHNILRKSVAALIAHAGYDKARDPTLAVLTDVADDFLRKFTINLRNLVEQEILHGPTQFPDIIEHLYHKMGFGSIRNIQGFYQTQVLDYRETVRNECLKLVGEYQVCCALLQVKDPPFDVRYKKEEGDESDIPQIHFPAVSDGNGIDELQPSLEPEFQMLEMLEQEAHSISYKKEEVDPNEQHEVTYQTINETQPMEEG